MPLRANSVRRDDPSRGQRILVETLSEPVTPSLIDTPSFMCRHCFEMKDAHADGWCLFMSTKFNAFTIGEMAAHVMRESGSLL